jgi:hypothetical protein
MQNFVVILSRLVCFAIGAGLAGVGMYASYIAAKTVGNEYLMIAVPLVAFAAPVTLILVELAIEFRQYVKMIALIGVFALTATAVFYTAAERNHDGRAVGEAMRTESRKAADRATIALTEAKAERVAATAKADKVRGQTSKRATALLDAEKEAIARVVAAEKAVAAASSHAVTDSDIQQADWFLPIVVDASGTVFFWLAFGLGKIVRTRKGPEVQVVEKIVERIVEVPASPAAKPVKPMNSKRSAASKLGHQRRRERLAKEAKAQGIASGNVVAING